MDPTGKDSAWWATRWESALNAFAITLDERINEMLTVDPPETVTPPLLPEAVYQETRPPDHGGT